MFSSYYFEISMIVDAHLDSVMFAQTIFSLIGGTIASRFIIVYTSTEEKRIGIAEKFISKQLLGYLLWYLCMLYLFNTLE